MERKEDKTFKFLGLFSTLFITFLLTSNIIASKVADFKWFIGTSAMVIFPVSYILNDILTEVYGYEVARKIIWYGFLANLVASVIFSIAVILPYPSFWEHQQAFEIVLGAVPRVVIFSLIAYWVGSFANAYVLAKMKEWMYQWDPRGVFLGFRTIGSTIVGEGLDSLIFIPGVFLGVLPLNAIIQMTLVQWAVKTGIEIFATPITYWVVDKIKKLEGIDVVGAKNYNPFSA